MNGVQTAYAVLAGVSGALFLIKTGDEHSNRKRAGQGRATQDLGRATDRYEKSMAVHGRVNNWAKRRPNPAGSMMTKSRRP